ncbi:unnamed protein product, partial [Owenia fusiformis]
VVIATIAAVILTCRKSYKVKVPSHRYLTRPPGIASLMRIGRTNVEANTYKIDNQTNKDIKTHQTGSDHNDTMDEESKTRGGDNELHEADEDTDSGESYQNVNVMRELEIMNNEETTFNQQENNVFKFQSQGDNTEFQIQNEENEDVLELPESNDDINHHHSGEININDEINKNEQVYMRDEVMDEEPHANKMDTATKTRETCPPGSDCKNTRDEKSKTSGHENEAYETGTDSDSYQDTCVTREVETMNNEEAISLKQENNVLKYQSHRDNSELQNEQEENDPAIPNSIGDINNHHSKAKINMNDDIYTDTELMDAEPHAHNPKARRDEMIPRGQNTFAN